MRKINLISILMLIAVICVNTQVNDFEQLTGPYFGQKPPGMIPEIFAPGIVSSTEATEYGITFSPDGKEFYFNRNGVGIMVCNWQDYGFLRHCSTKGFLQTHRLLPWTGTNPEWAGMEKYLIRNRI